MYKRAAAKSFMSILKSEFELTNKKAKTMLCSVIKHARK